MKLLYAIVAYSVAMLLANASVAHFGPSVTPVTAFVLIGLDLSLRDWLHYRLRSWQMLTLIVLTGLMSYSLDTSQGIIAVASAVAFCGSSLVDWATFSRLKGSWTFRSNASNVAGAAVDSTLFPTIAFGALMPQIVVMQFLAKVAGGALWTWAVSTRVKKPRTTKG